MFEIDYNICEKQLVVMKIKRHNVESWILPEHYNNKTVVNMEMAKTNIKTILCKYFGKGALSMYRNYAHTQHSKHNLIRNKYLQLNLKKK